MLYCIVVVKSSPVIDVRPWNITILVIVGTTVRNGLVVMVPVGVVLGHGAVEVKWVQLQKRDKG